MHRIVESLDMEYLSGFSRGNWELETNFQTHKFYQNMKWVYFRTLMVFWLIIFHNFPYGISGNRIYVSKPRSSDITHHLEHQLPLNQ